MKIQHRANTNALLSALIWGLMINLIVRNSIGFVPNGIFHKILWDSGTFLALMLYPALLSTILQKKTNLWLSVFFFSTLGSALSIWILFAFDSFQNKAWLTIAVLVLIVWLLIQKVIPVLEQHPGVQTEWESPLWERLNDFSLSEFLFLRFDFTDYTPVSKPGWTNKEIASADKEKSSRESICPSCGQNLLSPRLFSTTRERIKLILVVTLLAYILLSVLLCMMSAPPEWRRNQTQPPPAYTEWIQPLSKMPVFQIIVGGGVLLGFLLISWEGIQTIRESWRKARRNPTEKEESTYRYKCPSCGHQWN